MLCMRACGLVRDMAEHDVLNVIDRIRDTCILCHALIRKVHTAGEIDRNIFKQSVAADRLVDIGLCVRIEIDNLRVAAALVVEDPLIIPAMLIIADEKALVVRRERGLTCAGEAEEERCILSLLVRICRTVHGGDALEGEVVVHHREHTLLHLAAIPRIDDDLLTTREVKHHRRLRVESEITEVHNTRLCGVVDDKVRLEVLKFFCRRTNEHIRDEVCLPGNLYDKTHGHTRILVGTAECIDNEETLVAELTDRDLAHGVPCLLGRAMVIIWIFLGCPPDRIM